MWSINTIGTGVGVAAANTGVLLWQSEYFAHEAEKKPSFQARIAPVSFPISRVSLPEIKMPFNVFRSSGDTENVLCAEAFWIREARRAFESYVRLAEVRIRKLETPEMKAWVTKRLKQFVQQLRHNRSFSLV